MGKLSENVWKRSVLKQIKTKREEVVTGTGMGENCAVLSLETDKMTAVSLCTRYWPGKDTAKYALCGSVNALAASGAEPVAVNVSIILPEGTEETNVKEIMAQIETECGQLGLQVTGCTMEVTGIVSSPVITVAGIGKLVKENRVSVKRIKPGQDIVASKWIGLEGTAFLAKNKEQELRTKYSTRFLEEAKRFGRFLPTVPEAATAIKSGVCAMYSVSEGGIFGALWEMAAGAGVGLEIDLKKIPVKQETIEICEFFELNPYGLASEGCLLMATEKGYDLVRELEKEHIEAAVIGKTTDGNDRVIVNNEERRFLEMPKADELYKVISQ